MGRNEIKLRRQSMSSRRISKHRNFDKLMARHEKDIRLKWVFQLIMYFVVVVIMLVLFIVVKRLKEKQMAPQKPTSGLVQTIPNDF